MLQSSQLPQILTDSGINLENNLIQSLNWNSPEKLPLWNFCTDSRNVPSNSWFVALKGENFDGHKFCHLALERGAAGLIVSDLSGIDNSAINLRVPTLVVKDTLDAYQSIARAHRAALKATPRDFPKTQVVAITGSNGKTTTKEMLFRVLSKKFQTKASKSNENNEIGVPKNLLELTERDQFMVSECGMRGLGQIEELTKITEPNFTIITNIGTAHIGLLSSRENIAKAKSEIFRFQPKGGIALLPFNEPLLEPYMEDCNKDIQFIQFGDFQNPRFEGESTTFEYKGQTFSLQTPSLGLVHNSCAVIDLALHLGLSAQEIQAGLDEFQPVAGRGTITTLKLGATLIDESYNANPDSVRELARSLKRLTQSHFQRSLHSQTLVKSSILVLGEMAELGDLGGTLLSSLANDLNQNVNEIFLIGEDCFDSSFLSQITVSHKVFKDLDAAAKHFFDKKNELLNSQKIVAVKASRSAKLNELIDKIHSIE